MDCDCRCSGRWFNQQLNLYLHICKGISNKHFPTLNCVKLSMKDPREGQGGEGGKGGEWGRRAGKALQKHDFAFGASTAQEGRIRAMSSFQGCWPQDTDFMREGEMFAARLKTSDVSHRNCFLTASLLGLGTSRYLQMHAGHSAADVPRAHRRILPQICLKLRTTRCGQKPTHAHTCMRWRLYFLCQMACFQESQERST